MRRETNNNISLPKEIHRIIVDALGLNRTPEINQDRYNALRRELFLLSEDLVKTKSLTDKYSDAYFAYNFPTNFAKTIYITRISLERHPAFFGGKTEIEILDLGCGEGAGIFGAYYALREKFSLKQFHLTGIDRSEKMLARSRAISTKVSEINPGVKTEFIRQNIDSNIFMTRQHKYDIVIFGNSLIEIIKTELISKSFIERIIDCLTDQGLVIIVEPALKDFARRLMALRSIFIKYNMGHVLMPCIHLGPCPLLEISDREEWCHMSIPWEPPGFLNRLNQGLNREIDLLKFSYLIISKKHASRKCNDGYLVISRPIKEKGKKKVFLCAAQGRIELVRLDKDRSSENLQFDRIASGDIIHLKNPMVARPCYWQIKRGTQIRLS